MRRLLAFLIIPLLVSGCSQGEASYRKSALLMGTIVRIDIRDNKNSFLFERAAQRAFSRMRQLAGSLDYYSGSSEVSKVNSLGGRDAVNISEDAYLVIREAREMFYKTGGAFDVTVAPLSELWGLYKKGASAAVPAESGIRAGLEKVGSDRIILDETARSAGFEAAGMKMDLGGIAKGYIVDRAAEVLKDSGIENFLIEAGGDIICTTRPDGKPWRIGMQDPAEKGRIIGVIELENSAVTTSGSYENFIEINGERYSHIIDPRTGYPVRNGVRSVTVTAPTCAAADAIATAVFVLGEAKGLELVEGLDGFGCVIVTGEGPDLKIIMSENVKDRISLL